MLLEFPLELQAIIEVVDPSISHYLRKETDILNLERWVANIDFQKVELIFIPYNEK